MPKRRNSFVDTVRHILTAVIVVSLVLYAALLIVLFVFQRDLIFVGQDTKGIASSQVTPGMGEQLVRLSAGRTPVTGLFGQALTPAGTLTPRGSDCATVIFFVGNGSCIAGSLDIIEEFRRLGANVMTVDYPGYGMSGGTASEAGAYAAADAAYQYVVARPDCDARKVVSAGWSLGSSVATHLASTRPVAGLAVWSAFTEMAEESNHQYPMVPTPLIRLLLKYPFPTIREIALVKSPIFMAHGTDDHFVPLAMSRRLAAAAAGPVTWVPVDGAQHNDIFDVGGKALYDRFGQWLAKLPASAA